MRQAKLRNNQPKDTNPLVPNFICPYCGARVRESHDAVYCVRIGCDYVGNPEPLDLAKGEHWGTQE